MSRQRDAIHDELVKTLAKVLECEILNANKASYSSPEPYAPSFIAIGATLKRIVDALRAEPTDQHETKTASWVKHPWNPEDPRCVLCGEGFSLTSGCVWDDDDDLNLCHDCAITVIRELTGRT